MLDFLDKDSPDETRLSVLKKLFLTAATERISTRESVLPQQYMKICRTLSSGEVMVLQAAYEIAKSGGPQQQYTAGRGAHNWLKDIAGNSGLKYRELVEIHERKLIEKNLLSPREREDWSDVSLGQHFRLTDLAFGICQFLENYEELTPLKTKND